MSRERLLENLLIPFFSLIFGIGASLGIAALLGENPIEVAHVIFSSALGSATNIGYSLYYATPLLLTGLSVSWAFRAGLFNIGAEGQMALGGVALAATGILFPVLPAPIALPLAFFFAFLTGGIWGGLAGWIKAKRGCHEVLTTILLNFIAYGVSSYLILGVFKNPESQVPETAAVGSGYQIGSISYIGAHIGGTSPLNWSIFLGLFCIAIYGFIFHSTRFGFYQRLTGEAPEVGRRAGINIDRQTIIAMFCAGGFAGLAGTSPVLGFAFKTREGFTSGAGFVGIVVALLARNSPLGIVFASLLFGVLTKGALDLDLDTDHISRDLATVIQALIVLAVASQPGLLILWRKWRREHVV